jgi:hypothetical protein
LSPSPPRPRRRLKNPPFFFFSPLGAEAVAAGLERRSLAVSRIADCTRVSRSGIEASSLSRMLGS